MNIQIKALCVLSTTLLALNATAFDMSSAMNLLPLGPKSEPAPATTTAAHASAQDAALERKLNVFFGEAPVAMAGDKQCETVVATDPLDVMKNAAMNTLNTTDVANTIGGFLKGGGIDTATAKAKTLDVLRQELKRQVWLPLIVEQQVGASLLEERGETIVEADDPQAVELFAKMQPIFDDLVKTTASMQPYRPKLYLVTDDTGQPQAEALPGGIILVNMVLAQSEPDRIAGYMAHELGHVSKRHQTMALQAKLIDTVNTVDDIKGMLKAPDGKLVDLVLKSINLRGQAFTRYYSNQELEADACGAKFLASNRGSDGLKSINKFLEDIEASTKPAATKSAAAIPENQPLLFQELHPTFAERRQTLEGSFRHWLNPASTAAR